MALTHIVRTNGIPKWSNKRLVLPAGDTTQLWSPEGLIYYDTTTIGTDADTVEKTLYTYTLPGNTLRNVGDYIRVEVRGKMGATADAKTPKLYFGAADVGSTTGSWNNLWFKMEGKVILTGVGTQKADMRLDLGSTGTGYNVAPAEDETGDIIVKFTGKNNVGNANDVQGFTFAVFFGNTVPS